MNKEKSDKVFYITTPIYYVNDVPHIGHAYTTVAADVLARFKRLDGYDVFFLTGTDEHGSKVEESAKKNNEKPIDLADRVVQRFKNSWKIMNISYDDFIRTTEARHKETVTALIQKVFEKGDIYLGEYEDWYCVPCETFWTGTQLAPNNKCPECHRDVQKLKEESYFFKMSQYAAPLLKYINDHTAFIEPESRKNEIMSFIKEGLRDLSISRTTVSWGISMPQCGASQKKHIIYIWFDALINYISALGVESNKFKKYWPHTIHLVGKDIIRHHAIYWPTFLFSLGITPPKKIFAHGWWTHDGQKMSKSKGNFIDHEDIAKTFGVDPLRYFMMREIPFGSDGDFSKKALKHRINSDLANDFGNLVNRTFAMSFKFLNGVIQKPKGELLDIDKELALTYEKAVKNYCVELDEFSFHKALESMWEAIRATNKYIDRVAPWKLKDDLIRVNTVLASAQEGIRISAVLISPFMPNSAEKILNALGMKNFSCGERKDCGMEKLCTWWQNQEAFHLTPLEPLFPKFE